MLYSCHCVIFGVSKSKMALPQSRVATREEGRCVRGQGYYQYYRRRVIGRNSGLLLIKIQDQVGAVPVPLRNLLDLPEADMTTQFGSWGGGGVERM
jgi:hypothetical protein